MKMQRIVWMVLLVGAVAAMAQGQRDPYGGSTDRHGYRGDPGRPSQGDDEGRRQGYGEDRDRRPDLDVGFFYDELSPFGEWVRHPSYGWVWFPRHVQAGWRPYSLGRWVGSEVGWMWVSEEPFGWATYHYGRWAWDRRVGWLWVPGTDWAPAWVAWQQGNGYIGWAPLPPTVGFDFGVGIRLGGLNVSLDIAPRRYAFIAERRFLDSRISSEIVPEGRNVTIINLTRNVTNYTVVGDRVMNNGMSIDRIEQVTGHRAPRLRVAASSRSRETRVQREVIQIYRPDEARLDSVRVGRRNNAGLQAPTSTGDWLTPQSPAIEPTAGANGRRELAPLAIPVAPRSGAAPREESERQFLREKRDLEASEARERRALEQVQRQELVQSQAQARVNARIDEGANAEAEAAGKPRDNAGSTREPGENPGTRVSPQARARADAGEVAKRHATELEAQQEKRESTEQQLQVRQQIQRDAAQAGAGKHAKPGAPSAGQVDPERDKKEEQGKKDSGGKGR